MSTRTKAEAKKAKERERLAELDAQFEVQRRIKLSRQKETLDNIALNQLVPAALKGDLDAMVLLGVYYEVSEKDTSEAKKWYAYATNRGSASAMGALADLLDINKTAEDPIVKYWYEEGAKRGDFRSLNWVTSDHGKRRTPQPDTVREKAIKYCLLIDSLHYTETFPILRYVAEGDTLSITRFNWYDYYDMSMVYTQETLGYLYAQSSNSNTIEQRKADLTESLRWYNIAKESINYLLTKIYTKKNIRDSYYSETTRLNLNAMKSWVKIGIEESEAKLKSLSKKSK